MQFYRVDTIADAEELVRIMPEVIAVDTEYVKGDPRTTELLSVIIADGERAWACHPSTLPTLTPCLQSRKIVFLQDYNHCDTIILYQNGCDLRETNCYNLIDMHHIINETLDHDLGSRVLETFGDNYKDVFWRLYKNFEDAPEDEALEYQCKDGIYTYRLGIQDINALKNPNRGIGRFELYEHTRRLSLALLDTELQGVCVNQELMVRTRDEMKAKIEEYLPKLREEFKHEVEYWEQQKWEIERSKRTTDKGRSNVPRPVFSFSSDRQLSWLVYEALGCPTITKTKKGNPSTDYETLNTLSKDVNILSTLVEYKDTKTVYSTFVEGMLERVQNGKIYPHFNVSGTDTGRLSHSSPNMGNLPREGVIRNFFIPSPGMVFIGADYAQLEVIVEANITDDPNLIRIIQEGTSKHDITANGLGLSRDLSKTLNFAMQYLCGEFKVGKLLNSCKCDSQTYYRGLRMGAKRDDCKCGGMEYACKVFDDFWNLYSGSKRKIEEVKQQLYDTGQVTNLFGRTRHFDCKGSKVEGRPLRQAYNFLIQGVAGDACNRAYWQMHKFLKASGCGRTMFSVHDEILCEVRPEVVDICKETLRLTMENVSLHLNFKYLLKSNTYGPLAYWKKA